MEYWIYLQGILGYGAGNALSVAQSVADISVLPVLSDKELESVGVTPAQLKHRAKFSFEKAQKIASLCKKENIKVIPVTGTEYPPLLKELENPPLLLYVMGDLPDFGNIFTAGIVGTRKISEYGKRAAFSLAVRLSLCGAVVVSGGAVGGDAMAHLGAVSIGAKTIAVCGGGVLSGYPKGNEPLRRKIIRAGGALVSEFMPEYVPKFASSFYLRNRVLSGICRTVAIIEAPQKSGAIITANLAAEQGRDVFAVPGKPDDAQYFGTNKLIADGARPLLSASDIFTWYSGESCTGLDLSKMESMNARELKELYDLNAVASKATKQTAKKATRKKLFANSEAPAKSQKQSTLKSMAKKPEKLPELSENCKLVYNFLSGGEYLADEISVGTSLTTSAVLSALTILEIKGLILALPGSRYRLK